MPIRYFSSHSAKVAWRGTKKVYYIFLHTLRKAGANKFDRRVRQGNFPQIYFAFVVFMAETLYTMTVGSELAFEE